MCGPLHIKEHIEFMIMCVVNSESIKREGSYFWRSFLISYPTNLGREDTVERRALGSIWKTFEEKFASILIDLEFLRGLEGSYTVFFVF